MPFTIDHLDHLVLTVADVDVTIGFSTSVLGMPAATNADRKSLHFGKQKINLHQAGHEIDPKAARSTPGSADICLITHAAIEEVILHLKATDCVVELERNGATGKIRSVDFGDPDKNLIEVSSYL